MIPESRGHGGPGRDRGGRARGGLRILALAALVVALDQLTKAWATAALRDDPLAGPSVLGGWLDLTYTTNTGAAFGVMANRGILFVCIAAIVIGLGVAYWRFLPSQRPLLQLSLGLLLGGAAGNLTDRVRLGFVTDFIQIKAWPVFNLADSSVVCGVAILMYYVLSPASDPRDPVP